MKKDPRVWSEFGHATNLNGVIAIQNPDRHIHTDDRKQYQKDWRKQWIAEGPRRRLAYRQQVCPKCWQLKLTDGSDGLGGFTPDNTCSTGWTKLCRCCRAVAKKHIRMRGKPGETRVAEGVEVPGIPPAAPNVKTT